MARPTIYNIETILEIANGYLDDCETGSEDFPRTLQIPIRCGMSKDQFYEYVKKSKELSDVLKKIKILQEDNLVLRAAKNSYNPGFVKFLLSAKHGYKDRTAIESTTTNQNFNTDYSTLTDDQLTKITAILESNGAATGGEKETLPEELL